MRTPSAKRINLRYLDGNAVAVALDETTSIADVADLVEALTGERPDAEQLAQGLDAGAGRRIPARARARSDPVLTHPVFNRYHTETEMMRYLKRLENRDFSLVHSHDPARLLHDEAERGGGDDAAHLAEFATLHPFAPRRAGARLRTRCSPSSRRCSPRSPASPRVSLQPNAGAQGEYAGLLAIRNYHAARGEAQRNVCLIPPSAHGTNPASAR